MKKLDKYDFVFLFGIILGFIALFFLSVNTDRKRKAATNEIMTIITSEIEKAYFEGQHDALKGDIRIDTNTLKWIKSPWDNGNAPIFQGLTLGGQNKNETIH